MLTITNKTYTYNTFVCFDSPAILAALNASYDPRASPYAMKDFPRHSRVEAYSIPGINAAVPNVYRAYDSFSGAGTGIEFFRRDGSGNVFAIQLNGFTPRSYASGVVMWAQFPDNNIDVHFADAALPTTPPASSKLFPGTFTVGSSFTSTLYGCRGAGYPPDCLYPLSYTFAVQAVETVTTPAGTFSGCFRCKIVQEWFSPVAPLTLVPRQEIIAWFLPDTFGIQPVRKFSVNYGQVPLDKNPTPTFERFWPMEWLELTSVSS